MAKNSVCSACGMTMEGEKKFCPTCGCAMTITEVPDAASMGLDSFASPAGDSMNTAGIPEVPPMNDAPAGIPEVPPLEQSSAEIPGTVNINQYMDMSGAGAVPPYNNNMGMNGAGAVPPYNSNMGMNGAGAVPPYNSNMGMNGAGAVPPYNNMGMNGTGVVPPYNNNMGMSRQQAQNNGKDSLALVGMIIGIVSILLFCLNWIDIPIAITGLVLSIIGLKSVNKKGMAVAGIICSVLGLLASIALLAGILFGMFSESDSQNDIYSFIEEYEEYDYDEDDFYEYEYHYEWD
ncbi:MAG: DUF4190 domain-containing protein [Ruminococcus sp.]|nr:DUF4190 domain-containing protein [Ruminococcus sp.]